MQIWRRNQQRGVGTPEDGVVIDLDAAFAAFREAADEAGHDGARLDHLKPSIRGICIVARRESVPAERLIVRLKKAMERLPVLDADPPEARDELRSRIIALAIAEYFSVGQ